MAARRGPRVPARVGLRPPRLAGATPWYDAYTTLAAAAAVTSRVRIGTLVTSPNFRHPVPTAHAVKTIDHVSGGRLTLAIGAGGTHRTSDAGVLGGDSGRPASARPGSPSGWSCSTGC